MRSIAEGCTCGASTGGSDGKGWSASPGAGCSGGGGGGGGGVEVPTAVSGTLAPAQATGMSFALGGTTRACAANMEASSRLSKRVMPPSCSPLARISRASSRVKQTVLWPRVLSTT